MNTLLVRRPATTNFDQHQLGLVITLKLIPNPELTQLILSYGADITVLKPEALKESIGKIWERAVRR